MRFSSVVLLGSLFFCGCTQAELPKASAATHSETAASGAERGKWTQDYEAAVKLAREQNLAIFLNFTGSDWCPWCILMEEKVLGKEAWLSFAKENVVLVKIDFPQDESRVPEAFRSRNNNLQGQWKVEGYPTFVLLDSSGNRELGRLGASRDATPEMFIAAVKKLLPAK